MWSAEDESNFQQMAQRRTAEIELEITRRPLQILRAVVDHVERIGPDCCDISIEEPIYRERAVVKVVMSPAMWNSVVVKR